MNRATLLFRLGRFDEAIADYEAAAAGDPSGRVHSALGTAFMNRARRSASADRSADAEADHRRALLAFAESLRLDPTSMQALLNRSLVHRRLGDLDSALADCESAVRAHATVPDPWYHRGKVRLLRGEAAEAESDLVRAPDLAPASWALRDEARIALERARKR